MHVVPFGKLVRTVAAGALGMTLGVAALVVVAAPPGQGATVPCQKTFTQPVAAPISPTLVPIGGGLPPLMLPPATGTSSIPVDPGTITDVDVIVNATYPLVNLLTLTLTHGSTTVPLKDVTSILGADLLGTTFDDEATQTLASALPPLTGSFLPASPLSAFDTSDAGGTWTLNALAATISPGSINSWSLKITYAGTCNNDGDPVEDHSDQCLGLAGATASGCPLATRSLTAKYRHGKFKGALSSSVASCKAARTVTVWKVRRGPDRKIGSKTTASDGTYKLKRARHRGKYYATSPRVVVPNVAECPFVQSRTFRIR